MKTIEEILNSADSDYVDDIITGTCSGYSCDRCPLNMDLAQKGFKVTDSLDICVIQHCQEWDSYWTLQDKIKHGSTYRPPLMPDIENRIRLFLIHHTKLMTIKEILK